MKKNKTLVLILGILLALALVVGLYFGIKALTDDKGTPAPATTGNPTEATENTDDTKAATAEDLEPVDPEMVAAAAKDVYTVEGITAEDSRFDAQVASCGDYTINNRLAQIYYFMQFYGFMNQYGSYASYFGLDASLPLSEQQSMTEGLTWEQYFLGSGIEEFHQLAAAATKANAEGYTLSEEESTQLQSVFDGLEDEAAEAGFGSAEEYIQESFGPGVSVADYETYLRMYFQAMSYENTQYQAITWTEEDLKAYFEAHPEDYEGIGTDTPNVNVRHILFTFPDEDGDGESTEEEKAAVKAKAEELLEGFLANPSEDYFAELANEHSEDPGSNTNGGLYEDVYPGQMVPAFNDWCFDPARKPGDTDIVETNYGFHVMYFVANTDTYYWKTLVEQDYPNSIMQTKIQEMMDACPITVSYEDIVLAPLPEPTTTAE